MKQWLSILRDCEPQTWGEIGPILADRLSIDADEADEIIDRALADGILVEQWPDDGTERNYPIVRLGGDR